MLREIAIIDVKADKVEDFADAFQKVGHELLAGAPGCLSAAMYHSEETPTRFVGVNEWESREAHLNNFRCSDRYTRYVAALGPFLASSPIVEHYTVVAEN